MESPSKEESNTNSSSVSSKLCLFYGFKATYVVNVKDCTGQYIIVYNGGNRCALTGEICRIQWDGENWSKCSLENKEELIRSMGKAKVYPKDLWPEKAESQKWVSLEEWMKYGKERSKE